MGQSQSYSKGGVYSQLKKHMQQGFLQQFGQKHPNLSAKQPSDKTNKQANSKQLSPAQPKITQYNISSVSMSTKLARNRSEQNITSLKKQGSSNYYKTVQQSMKKQSLTRQRSNFNYYIKHTLCQSQLPLSQKLLPKTRDHHRSNESLSNKSKSKSMNKSIGNLSAQL